MAAPPARVYRDAQREKAYDVVRRELLGGELHPQGIGKTTDVFGGGQAGQEYRIREVRRVLFDRSREQGGGLLQEVVGRGVHV